MSSSPSVTVYSTAGPDPTGTAAVSVSPSPTAQESPRGRGNGGLIFSSSSLLFAFIFMGMLIVCMTVAFFYQRVVLRRRAIRRGLLSPSGRPLTRMPGEKPVELEKPKLWDVYVGNGDGVHVYEGKGKDLEQQSVMNDGMWNAIKPLSVQVLKQPPTAPSPTVPSAAHIQRGGITGLWDRFLAETAPAPTLPTHAAPHAPTIPPPSPHTPRRWRIPGRTRSPAQGATAAQQSQSHAAGNAPDTNEQTQVQVAVVIAMPSPAASSAAASQRSRSDGDSLNSRLHSTRSTETMSDVSSAAHSHGPDDGPPHELVYELGVAIAPMRMNQHGGEAQGVVRETSSKS